MLALFGFTFTGLCVVFSCCLWLVAMFALLNCLVFVFALCLLALGLFDDVLLISLECVIYIVILIVVVECLGLNIFWVLVVFEFALFSLLNLCLLFG